MDIILRGPQGCGKTTMAQDIAQRHLGAPPEGSIYEHEVRNMQVCKTIVFAQVYTITVMTDFGERVTRAAWIFDSLTNGKTVKKLRRRMAMERKATEAVTVAIYVTQD